MFQQCVALVSANRRKFMSLTIHERTLPIHECELYVRTVGSGPPLVLLHGFTSSGASWEPFVEPLAREYTLIVPDLRGHGRSTNPSNQFTHSQAARDIFALLDRLGVDHFRAMGMSTGAMTLLHSATQQPARVEAMVLLGGTTYYPERARAIIRRSTVESATPERLEEMRRTHSHGDEQIRSLLAQFHGFKDSYDDMNFTPPYLSTITARTLVVHGDRDEYFALSIPLEIHRSIPGAHLWIVPHCGHGLLRETFASGLGKEMFLHTALAFLRGEWEG
jgi:pimeloyl-ACP methyl ester carboxylesterase